MDDLLIELDKAVDSRKDVIQKKERNIAYLKKAFATSTGKARYELMEDIYKKYDGFNTDSAMTCAKRLCALGADKKYGSLSKYQKAEIYCARCYAVSGLYEQSERILQSMADNVAEENRELYYKTCTLLYVWRMDFTTISELKGQYWQKVLIYRDSTILYITDPTWRVQETALDNIDNDLLGSKNQLRQLMKALPENSEYIRHIANSLASCYHRLGEADSARYYYAVSAIADLKSGILEYASLPELALQLFSEGDVTRAYNYTNCSLEDAKYCGAKLRILQMGSSMSVIMETYQNIVDAQKKRLKIIVAILALLLILVSGITIMVYRISQRLREARRQTVKANESLRKSKMELESALQKVESSRQGLEDANRIKESYVIQYMKQCSDGIAALDKYRHSIQKVANGGNLQKVVDLLRHSEDIEKEQQKFVRQFDESFLALFPSFIKDFNALLKPDEQLTVPADKLMTTELRIFALIRLGVNESEDIASFLNYSLKTIYNYRTRVRNKALGDRDSLEAEVMKIGVEV